MVSTAQMSDSMLRILMLLHLTWSSSIRNALCSILWTLITNS